MTVPTRLLQSVADRRATREERVRMRDGVRLATDVYLPAAGLGPVPTVLIRLPYDKTGRYTFIPQIAEHFAAHGFACVTQDVRGKYRSEGEREPFIREADDGCDTVDWIISQDWSNGAVGTWGDSYYGFTQWALASRHHPAHRAMVPRVTGHRFGDMRPGGGMPTFTLLDWVIDAWAVRELILTGGARHDTLPARSAAHPSLPDGQRLFERFVTVAEDPEAFVAGLFPDGNPAERLTIPALHTGGWFDNLQFWQLDDWHAAQRSPASEHQFLRMWTSDHEDYRWREADEPLVADFGEDADALAEHVPRLLSEAIPFLRHYLGDRHDRWPAATVRYEHARVGVRDAAEWPPRRSEQKTFHLAAGALTDSPATGELSWAHEPADPVPFPIRSEWDQNRTGLPDEASLHAREDVAIFDSPPLDAPLDLVGGIDVSARISAGTERTHVIARLLDVHPGGRATMILANATDCVADGRQPFHVRLGDTAYRLPAGHRLRLALSSSLAGQYPVHPGTDESAWDATTHRPSRQTLHLEHATLTARVDRG
ncbi:CocE/NonD family hydrolase [Microbacterium sp. CCNWLW134]|uniref:CocE/NonD family hydrolase n=1 Tax=Microbacterium sp. CCNWLW134 TaxID=3122064 RepID=UPI00300FBC90